MEIFIVLFVISTGLWIYERIKSSNTEIRNIKYLLELEDEYNTKVDNLSKKLSKDYDTKLLEWKESLKDIKGLSLSTTIEPVVTVDTKPKRSRKKPNEVI